MDINAQIRSSVSLSVCRWRRLDQSTDQIKALRDVRHVRIEVVRQPGVDLGPADRVGSVGILAREK